jgi:hypothetical protein
MLTLTVGELTPFKEAVIIGFPTARPVSIPPFEIEPKFELSTLH